MAGSLLENIALGDPVPDEDRAWEAARLAESRLDTTLVGGGSLPGMELPTAVVAIEPKGMSVDDAAGALRHLPVPVLARRKDDRLVLDLRSVPAGEDEGLLGLLSRKDLKSNGMPA